MSFIHERLLCDEEIERAIQRDIIRLEDKKIYLGTKNRDLIQPGSLDLTLLEEEDNCPMPNAILESARDEKPIERHGLREVHPEVDDNFVTFWPKTETEVSVENLIDYNGSILFPCVELRSTLRRSGLENDFMPFGAGTAEGHMFIRARNPQSYPISVEKGSKIAQILWMDKTLWLRGIPYDSEFGRIFSSPIRFGSGVPITSTKDLEKLIEKDIKITPLPTIKEGLLVFHAGSIATYNAQSHVIIRKGNNISGLTPKRDVSFDHTLESGVFVDIQTQERISLSNRIAIQLFYIFKEDKDYQPGDGLNLFLTTAVSHGLVDPGYGSKNQSGAALSMQMKTYTRERTISAGHPMAFGLVWFFENGVKCAYGHERGSHYGSKSISTLK